MVLFEPFPRQKWRAKGSSKVHRTVAPSRSFLHRLPLFFFSWPLFDLLDTGCKLKREAAAIGGGERPQVAFPTGCVHLGVVLVLRGHLCHHR